jgi:hypothetical protein
MLSEYLIILMSSHLRSAKNFPLDYLDYLMVAYFSGILFERLRIIMTASVIKLVHRPRFKPE